jgi:hypothetical protein
MPTFTAEMRVIHHVTWEVEAADEEDARQKFENMTPDVVDDDTGGEIVDWKVRSVRKA